MLHENNGDTMGIGGSAHSVEPTPELLSWVNQMSSDRISDLLVLGGEFYQQLMRAHQVDADVLDSQINF